ncbi:MAG: hypothetical protein J5737_02625 [Bacteroidales bacterium]|nr:hypothetical protein [Bacteroidales bacterium]
MEHHFLNKKGRIASWLTVITILLFVSFIILTSFYFSYRTYSIAESHDFFKHEEIVEHPSEATFWLSFTGIILSFFSIVTVVVTLTLQLRELNLQKGSIEESYKISADSYNAYVLKLIERFLGPEMAECRQTCWLLRQQLKTDSNATKTIYELFVMQVRDNWGTRDEYEKLQKTNSFIDYANFTKLIRFFDVLSHYTITKETAYAVHFYYVWWRSFFVKMINCYRIAEESVPANERNLTVSPSWCGLVDRMDAQMKAHGLELE